MYGSEAKYDREIPINATVEGIFIHHVVKNMTYKIQMAAFNRMGDGTRSDPVLIGEWLQLLNIHLPDIFYKPRHVLWLFKTKFEKFNFSLYIVQACQTGGPHVTLYKLPCDLHKDFYKYKCFFKQHNFSS